VPWGITEMQSPDAQKAWSKEQRRGAIRAWMIATGLMATVMLPLDLMLGLTGMGDVAAAGISGPVALGVGLCLSHLISRRLWPDIMARDDV
jgi:hypothetical protein